MADELGRTIELNGLGSLRITFSEKTCTGGSIWDAALVLAHAFTKEPLRTYIARCSTVAELGAGTGAVGLAAALLCGEVVLTDKSEVSS